MYDRETAADHLIGIGSATASPVEMGMLLGIVTDIYNAFEPIERALNGFQVAGVSQGVSIGDAFDSLENGAAAAKVAKLLHHAGAVGVWGNHDIGLSFEPTDYVHRKADPLLREFASSLKPQLPIGDCRFSHQEPWRDATSVLDLWSLGRVPNSPMEARRCFASVRERLLFIGHFHTWFVVSA